MLTTVPGVWETLHKYLLNEVAVRKSLTRGAGHGKGAWQIWVQREAFLGLRLLTREVPGFRGFGEYSSRCE